jgi:DNA-binding LacI/PurR family transcriptional regulator
MYARLVLKGPFDYDRMNFWASLVIYGFQEGAKEYGVNMVLEFADSIDVEVERTLAESIVPNCMGTCILSMPVETKHALKLAEAAGPVVLADWELEEPIIPCVEFDNIDAGRRAAEHLVKLGHRRIAFVTQPEPLFPPMRARQEGARHFMENLGVKLTTCEAQREEPFLAIDELLRSPDRPTAVIVVHGQLADYLMGVAASRGIGVPRDLSVIAFGERRWSRLSPITLVSMDEELLGRRALEVLLDEDIWANPKRVQLPGRAIELGSTAPPFTARG